MARPEDLDLADNELFVQLYETYPEIFQKVSEIIMAKAQKNRELAELKHEVMASPEQGGRGTNVQTHKIPFADHVVSEAVAISMDDEKKVREAGLESPSLERKKAMQQLLGDQRSNTDDPKRQKELDEIAAMLEEDPDDDPLM